MRGELAECDGFEVADDADLIFGKTPAATDVRGRLGTEEQRARSLGHLGRVHRVVVVRVEWEDGRELVDLVVFETSGDRIEVGLDLAEEDPKGAGAREPAVGHPGGFAIGEDEGCGAGVANGDGVRGDRSRRAIGGALQVNTTLTKIDLRCKLLVLFRV